MMIAVIVLLLLSLVDVGRAAVDGGCVKKCSSMLSKKWESIGVLGIKETNDTTFRNRSLMDTGFINTLLFNRSILDDFCQAFRKDAKCLKRCGDRTDFTSVMNSFAGIAYLCMEHFEDFTGHLPCYRKADREKNCYAPCHIPDETISELQEQIQIATQPLKNQRFNFNLPGRQESISKTCWSTNCVFDCLAPVIMDVCNDVSPANFLGNFHRAALGPKYEMLMAIGKAGKWPETCDQTINFNADTFEILNQTEHQMIYGKGYTAKGYRELASMLSVVLFGATVILCS